MQSANSSDYKTQTKSALIKIIEDLENKNKQLELILYKVNKGLYGKKSEKLEVPKEQLPLPMFVEEVEVPEVEEEQKTIVPAHERTKRKAKDLSHLPHIEILVKPESVDCSCCSKQMSQIGEERSRELEYEPARMFVNVYIRPKYACGSCKDKVVQAELPEDVKPLDKTAAGPALLSHILVSKYVDHLPLHRLEAIFRRKNVELSRKQMCEWVGAVTEQYLSRLWEALKRELHAEDYLQGDETEIKVQAPEQCETGYLWGKYSPLKKLVLFEYSPSRSGESAKELFQGFTGTLQTDYYAGYNKVLLPEKVIRIACLAHVRRKFVDLESVYPEESKAVLMMIGELYRLEKQWQTVDSNTRAGLRAEQSIPILLKLEQYLRNLSIKTLPKAPLMKAINYTLEQWEEILRIFDNGFYQLDNNPIEREMRPIAVGRKNYLFAGSHEGAKRAGIIYSLFGTARLHGVNPYEWLKDILKCLRSTPINQVQLLLPHNWGAFKNGIQKSAVTNIAA